MNSCEQRKCRFWDGIFCTDTIDFVRNNTGENCCRYHSNAISVEEYKEVTK